MTRRVDTHQVLPSLMFSIDATTPAPLMRYVSEQISVHRRTFLRRPQDPLSALEVAVTFFVHGQFVLPQLDIVNCWG